MKEVYRGGYNHTCEDCGKEWESSKEVDKCPNCGETDEGTQQG